MGKYRLKRWLPNIGLIDGTVGIPLMMIGSLLFITGKDVVFGIEGQDLHTLPFPKIPLLGYVLWLGILQQLLPPAITIRQDWLTRRWKRQVITWWRERRRNPYEVIDGHH